MEESPNLHGGTQRSVEKRQFLISPKDPSHAARKHILPAMTHTVLLTNLMDSHIAAQRHWAKGRAREAAAHATPADSRPVESEEPPGACNIRCKDELAVNHRWLVHDIFPESKIRGSLKLIIRCRDRPGQTVLGGIRQADR